MSYDIRIRVKAEGTDRYPAIATPEHDSPTYNLRDMFVACMDWDFDQDTIYPCTFVLEKAERGIKELKFHRDEYLKYNPANGWGNIDNAINVLESLRDCIYDASADVPIEALYMTW